MPDLPAKLKAGEPARSGMLGWCSFRRPGSKNALNNGLRASAVFD